MATKEARQSRETRAEARCTIAYFRRVRETLHRERLVTRERLKSLGGAKGVCGVVVAAGEVGN